MNLVSKVKRVFPGAVLVVVLIKVLLAPVVTVASSLALGIVIGNYAFQEFVQAKYKAQKASDIQVIQEKLEELEDKVSGISLNQGLGRK